MSYKRILTASMEIIVTMYIGTHQMQPATTQPRLAISRTQTPYAA